MREDYLKADGEGQGNADKEIEKAINVIRNGHGLPNYSGAVTKDALVTEMLNQRRYSLFYEGHRWVDMRRYDRLSQLPIDRTGDQVWTAMPIPQVEIQ